MKDVSKKFVIFFWVFIAGLFVITLLQCAPSPTAPPAQSCARFKVAAVPFAFKPGLFKSAPLTQPLGNISRMEMRVEDSRALLRTVRMNGMNATPPTGMDTLAEYRLENGYILVGDFRATSRDADSVTLKLTWQERDFDLVWYKPLDVPTGIYVDPKPPQAPRGCAE